jgi:hypothetical protein
MVPSFATLSREWGLAPSGILGLFLVLLLVLFLLGRI